MPARVTRVAWYDPTGTTLSPLVPGRACLSPNLPAPYGALSGAIDAGDTTIPVSVSATLPVAPFPIVIDKERMTVTAVAAGSWTVVRGAGGTTAAAHASGQSMMSTPLPLDGSGNEMRVCIVEEGWTAVTRACPTARCPAPGAPTTPRRA